MNTPRIVRRVVPALGDWPDHVPDVLRRVLAARGVTAYAQSQLRLADMPPPDGLGGIEAAIDLLVEAIRGDRHIVLVGDFDCDGATGTAVGVRGLRLLGASRVGYRVPHRVLHGYGLTPGLVEAMRPMSPDLVVTVDNGIASHAGVAAARALGWRVLVTDHHLPGATVPLADAIVNPNLAHTERCLHDAADCATCREAAQANAAFGGGALAGVGVLFYLLLAVRGRLRAQGWFDAARFPSGDPDLSTLLDLVAVGTVADMVSLDANNRRLVAAGLRRLRTGKGHAGLKALAEVAGRDLSRLTTADIGFAIGPRINAAGRLEDMAIGIACLLADDPVEAAGLARTLDAINRERRGVQDEMLHDADRFAAEAAIRGDAAALCVFDPDWHPGVIGLVASKLKDRLHRPVVAFAPVEPGSSDLRGSARSIRGFHVRDALAAVDARHPGLIDRFGGHAMAAGLGIAHARLAEFMDAFREHAEATLDPALLRQELASDGPLEPRDMTAVVALALRDAAPWGQGFEEPLFDGIFDVLAWRPVGDRHLALDLGLGALRLRAIAFGGWDGVAPPKSLRIAYRLACDDWRGGDAVQLVVVHREPA